MTTLTIDQHAARQPRPYDNSYYIPCMSTISFRADSATEAALRGLTSGDLDRSAAIREAILAAWRLRQAAALQAEAEALAHDAEDRREIQAVHADLEELRAW